MLTKNEQFLSPAIHNILKQNRITIPLGNFAHLKTMTISWPDLSQFPVDVSGDWGPNYKIHTRGMAGITFVVEDTLTKTLQERVSRPDTLEIQSPILAQQREQNPLCMKLVDPNTSIEVCCYFSKEGTVGAVDVTQPTKKHIILD